MADYEKHYKDTTSPRINPTLILANDPIYNTFYRGRNKFIKKLQVILNSFNITNSTMCTVITLKLNCERCGGLLGYNYETLRCILAQGRSADSNARCEKYSDRNENRISPWKDCERCVERQAKKDKAQRETE